jgi:cytochrome c peroxidase
VTKIRGIPGYKPLFASAFGSDQINIDYIAKAIATYERTVLSGNSPYDRYRAGKKNAMAAQQIRGYDVFVNRAKCDQCHEGINFTTNAYHNLGIGMEKPKPDEGRFVVTKNAADWGAFKTPTLREIANTSPYMHDGSLKTLRDVVDFYDKGGTANKNLDEKIKPIKMTEQEKSDLVEFLKALSGEGWQNAAVPTKFPE